MKGYFSFILVFIISLLIISSIELYQTKNSFSLSKAIISERAYGVGSNAEYSISQSLIQGAVIGFNDYDSTHSILMCNHCQDFYCSIVPASPNMCDPLLCATCFRDKEAIESSKTMSINTLQSLGGTGFDRDFYVSFNNPEIEVFFKPNLSSKNGVSFSHIRTTSPILLNINSSKFNITAKKIISSGLVKYG